MNSEPRPGGTGRVRRDGTPVQIRANPPDPELVAERLERLTTDALVTRRSYLEMLAVLSGGLAAGSLAVAAGAFERRTQNSHARKLVTDRASEVAVGGQVRFSYPRSNDPAVVLRLGEDDWVGYSAVCTHLSCEVLWKSSSRELYCPCHDGHFDPRSGRPIAGPPKRPLPQIRLQRSGDELWAIGEGRIREPGE